MEYILQTDNLSKVYGAKTVLDHVSILCCFTNSMVLFTTSPRVVMGFSFPLVRLASTMFQLDLPTRYTKLRGEEIGRFGGRSR